MQGVCQGAGAAVLELVLPEEEEEDAQQENTNPNGTRLQPKQEVSTCSAVCLLQVYEDILCVLFSTRSTGMRLLILFFLGDLQSSEGMSILYLAELLLRRMACHIHRLLHARHVSMQAVPAHLLLMRIRP